MQTTTGAILLVIGVVALFAAIVGGGVKIKEIEVGSLPSRWRQIFLAIFGIVVGVTGLVMVMDPGEGSKSAEEPSQNSESTDQGGTTGAEPTVSDNTADENGSDTTATDTTTSEESNSADASGQQE
jgi:hypothetical protein